jgi:homoserine kinase type II
MSVFTTVTPDQFEVWLKNYALGTLTDLQGIAAGIENTNYFVTTTQGRYVLTLFEKLKPRELPFYLNLMAHLAHNGVPAPAPIADNAGAYLGELNGKPASLVIHLAGKDIEQPDTANCASVGTALGSMHIAGQSYPAKMENPRGPHWWKAALPEILPFVSAADAAMLREEIRVQALYRFSDLPRGAIHADLFRDNVLFDNGCVEGIIDFYFACTDVLLYDVAITVNDWCMGEDGRLDNSRAGALLAAYHSTRPFSAIECAAWTTLLRAGALRFWVSRLYDLHLPRPGEMTHIKDPAHFRRILSTHIEHEHELPRLPQG